LKSMGFVPFDTDPCLLRLVVPSKDGSVAKEIIAEVFVDDIKWGFNDEELAKKVITQLGSKYKTTVGKVAVNSKNCDTVDWTQAEVRDYLGMRYTRSHDDSGYMQLKVDQTSYVDLIVSRFGLDDEIKHKDRATPLPAGSSVHQIQQALGKCDDEELKQWAKEYSYPMIIGSLIHAMVHTRPDIAYAVSILSRSMANPELWHYKGARHLILYLRSTRELGLTYNQRNMHEQKARVTAATDHHHDPYFEAAVDASFADDDDTHRSTSGFVVWFGGSPIEWECKRQPLVTMSTMESEYVAASRCVLSVRFLQKFLAFVELERKHPTKIHEDNAACIAITNKPVHRQRSKHIGVKFANVREASQNGEVKLVYVWTEHQVADMFTKSLNKATFARLRDTLLGLVTFHDMVMSHTKNDVKKLGEVKYITNEEGHWPRFVIPLEGDTFGAAMLGLTSEDLEEG
jgi:hypothetical protein